MSHTLSTSDKDAKWLVFIIQITTLYFNFRVKDAAPRSPPSALKKRLERLNSLPEAKHPVTVYKDGNVAKLRFGLPAQDQEIADRLQQLKS